MIESNLVCGDCWMNDKCITWKVQQQKPLGHITGFALFISHSQQI